MKPKIYADLASLPEDDRIALIVQAAVVHQKQSAVMLEKDAAKVERYKRKILAAAPGALTVKVAPGLTRNTVYLIVKPYEAPNLGEN